MKVAVDRVNCQSNGVCVALAPAVFDFDDDLRLNILVDNVPAELEQVVIEAVEQCPRSALTLK